MAPTGSESGTGETIPCRSAFDEIYDRHKNFVFKLAFYLARDKSEAEDLFQETWLRVARNYAGIKGDPGKLKPWLGTIVCNMHKDRLRRKKTRLRHFGRQIFPETAEGTGAGAYEAVDSAPGPEKSAENAALAVRLKKALDILPERQRRVFILKEVEGLSLEEVAEALGTPLGTVKSLGFRAVRSLRRLLSEQENIKRKSLCDVGIVKAI
ncbi:MAG: sigma-70 family RNA polymerase sigma factor [Candidatus Aminicenantes bacterium]|nr:sigma-70 family RNA polymerase sigma factor [Candidatus Aminicenantes bacterium]